MTGDYDEHEFKGVIGQRDFFTGLRPHACIAGLSQGIPCAGAAYSRKFAGVSDSVGMGEWVVEARSSTEDEAVTRVIELYRRRNVVRAELRLRAEQARAQLHEVFDMMLTASGGTRRK